MATDYVSWPDAVATMCFIATAGVCFLGWLIYLSTRGGDED